MSPKLNMPMNFRIIMRLLSILIAIKYKLNKENTGKEEFQKVCLKKGNW